MVKNGLTPCVTSFICKTSCQLVDTQANSLRYNTKMSPSAYKLFYQRNLPHYQPAGATLFITFRLAGSLPIRLIKSLNEEMKRQESELSKITDTDLRKESVYIAQKKVFGKWDMALDVMEESPKWLANPEIAQLIVNSIHYRDGKEYILDAYCIMPNHVHLVFTPMEQDGHYISISEIMHSLKGYTARYANQILGRQGDFWHHESYDHVIRDHKEYERVVNYVLENPTRAGLPAKWVYKK